MNRKTYSVGVLPNSEAKALQLFIREFAACAFFFAVVISPAFFVTAAVVIYALFIA